MFQKITLPFFILILLTSLISCDTDALDERIDSSNQRAVLVDSRLDAPGETLEVSQELRFELKTSALLNMERMLVAEEMSQRPRG